MEEKHKKRRELMFHLSKTMFNNAQIARCFGISRERVRQILQESGKSYVSKCHKHVPPDSIDFVISSLNSFALSSGTSAIIIILFIFSTLHDKTCMCFQ